MPGGGCVWPSPGLFNMITGISQEELNNVENELRSGILFDQVMARARQKAIGIVNSKKHKSIDGLGQKKASIDATSFHFWGNKLGYDCWRDKKFLDEYLRDNPQARVNSGGTKLQFGFERNVKFSKTYETK